MSDVIKPKENLLPLSKNLRLKKPAGPAYVEIVHSMMKHVADVYPGVKELILKAVTPEDQKDHTLRAIANLIRFVLKMISR